MKRFQFKRELEHPTGFALGLRIGEHTYGFWLGYGRPVWWKPHFIGREKSKFGFGIGWLLLCFRVQVFEV
jgi:hypothetical protein